MNCENALHETRYSTEALYAHRMAHVTLLRFSLTKLLVTSLTNAHNMATSIGLIGPGAMGLGITQSLLRGGYQVLVRDINPERNRLALEAGAEVREHAAAIAREAHVVITVVVDAAQTREVCLGTNGIASALPKGGVVIMCSTIAPDDTASIATELEARGLHLLDAPISGGPARAAAGTISMMLAGSAAVLKTCEPVLAALSDKRFVVSHTPGDGGKMKLVNNLMAGINLSAAAEAFALGIKAGLDPHKIYDVVMASSGQSWMAGDRMKRILTGDRTVTAAMPILTKDVGLAMDMARSLRAPVPVGSQSHQVLLSALALGHAHEDDAAVIRYYQALTGIDLP